MRNSPAIAVPSGSVSWDARGVVGSTSMQLNGTFPNHVVCQRSNGMHASFVLVSLFSNRATYRCGSLVLNIDDDVSG